MTVGRMKLQCRYRAGYEGEVQGVCRRKPLRQLKFCALTALTILREALLACAAYRGFCITSPHAFDRGAI